MLLDPSGNVSLCANDPVVITCVTTVGPLLWETTTGNQLFTTLQAPVIEGSFNLVVNSADQRVEGGETLLRVNSTASASNFIPTQDIVPITCREITTDLFAEVLLKASELLL